MATNLVSLVMQFLTPDMIGRVAAALGLDRGNVQTAIDAAVPALLAGVGGASSKPTGAQHLIDAIKQQSGVLDGFASTIGSGNQSSLIDKGTQLLASSLGSQDQSALAGAVARFSGLGQSASHSLLGMLAPIVIGTIGKQIGVRSLDANSLANLFAAQKTQIAQALPSGFGNLLRGTGLLDSLGGVAGTAAAAAGQATRVATTATDEAAQFAASAARVAGNTAQRSAGAARSATPSWVYWSIPLVVLAGVLWYLSGDRTEQAIQPVATSAQSVMVGGVDVGRQIGDSLGALRTSLQGITDDASARATLPRLQEITTQFDKVVNLVGQLSPEQRKIVVGLVGPAMTNLNQLFDKVLAIPGIGEVSKPTIDALKTKLAMLTA
jgi:hypothetical protein